MRVGVRFDKPGACQLAGIWERIGTTLLGQGKPSAAQLVQWAFPLNTLQSDGISTRHAAPELLLERCVSVRGSNCLYRCWVANMVEHEQFRFARNLGRNSVLAPRLGGEHVCKLKLCSPLGCHRSTDFSLFP
jgi:hypothetical protein